MKKFFIASLVLFSFCLFLYSASADVGMSIRQPNSLEDGQNLYWAYADIGSHSGSSLMKLQIKDGASYETRIRVDMDGNLDAFGEVNADDLCIKGVCKENWDSVSAWEIKGDDEIYYDTANVGIGLTDPLATFHVKAIGGGGGGGGGGGPSYTKDFNDGNISDFNMTGNANWGISGTAQEGSSSAKAGTIGNNQNSGMNININSPQAGTMTFYYKVSSEPGYDYLRFFVDGIQQEEWAGEIDWTSYSIPVSAGNHNYEWRYDKDGSVSNGSDTGWIDNIVISSVGGGGGAAAGTAAVFEGNVGIGTTNPGANKLQIDGIGCGADEVEFYASGTSDPTFKVGDTCMIGGVVTVNNLDIDGRAGGSSGQFYVRKADHTDIGMFADGGNVYISDKLGVGSASPTYELDVMGKVGVNDVQTIYVPDHTDFQYSLILGNGGDNLTHNAGWDGYENTFVGMGTGIDNTIGYRNTFLGALAGGNNTTGSNNTFIGMYAGTRTTSGYRNTFVGGESGTSNITGSGNVYMGWGSGDQNTSGWYNTMIGNAAGYDNITGSGNVFLGNNAGGNETGSDKLYIENSNSANPLIWGDFSNNELVFNANVGVGTSPSNVHALEVSGKANATELCIAGSCKNAWPAAGGSSLWTEKGDGEIFFDGANVGIGTNDPLVDFDVDGFVRSNYLSVHGQFNPSLVFCDENFCHAKISQSNDPSVGALDIYWEDINIGDEFNNKGIFLRDNRIGVNDTTPSETLDVSGAIKIGNTSNNNTGTIRWTGSDFQGRTGSGWKSLTATGGGGGADGYIGSAGSHTAGGNLNMNNRFIDNVAGLNLRNTSNTDLGTIRWTGSDFEGRTGSGWKSFTATGGGGTGGSDGYIGSSGTHTAGGNLDMSSRDIYMDGNKFIHNYAPSSSKQGNVFIGDNSGNTTMTYSLPNHASNNVAVGPSTLNSLTTGYQNVAMGVRALTANQSGTGNIALGQDALPKNTTGHSNIAIGRSAYYDEVSGSNNIAIGTNAGIHRVSGNQNIEIGFHAGWNNITGDRNILIGTVAQSHADISDYLNIGDAIYGDLTDEHYPLIGIGPVGMPQASLHIRTATDSRNAEIKIESDGSNPYYNDPWGIYMERLDENLYFWHQDTDNLFMLDTTGSANVLDTAGNKVHELKNNGDAIHRDVHRNTGVSVQWAGSSDERLKRNIETIDNPLGKIGDLRGVYFNWNDLDFNKNFDKEARQTGVIAQEVEKIMPEVIGETKSGYKTVDYEKLTGLLIEGIKEQQEEIDDQQKQIDELREMIEKLKN